MATTVSLVFVLYHLYRLEVMFLVLTFLYIYPYMLPLLSIHSKINDSTSGELVVNVTFYLTCHQDITAWCFWSSLFLLSISQQNTCQISLYNQQNSCWTPSVHSSNQAYLVSRSFLSESSVQAKNVLLLYDTTGVTWRSTLLNDFDDQCFYFTDLFSVSIPCIFVWSTCNVVHKMEEAIRMQILAYSASLFYHLSELEK